MALLHWLQLSLTEGIGPILARRLIDAAGGIEPACEARATLIREVNGLGNAKARSVAESLQSSPDRARLELDRAGAQGIRVLCPDDREYPVLLRSITDPPLVLYIRGGLEPRDLNAVAIVGSRKCSYYGREQAERFGASLAGVGVTVISGGARGIDSAAHRGALAHPQGRTIAVLGSGLDVPYPPENEPLFKQISEGRGAVLSEFSLGTPPNRENFPRRNRVVSGMARGVLVVEADEKSGALITARQAGVDHGRTVMALPGRIDNPLSAGPHQLIRDGATLVTNVTEVFDALDPLPKDAIDPDLFAEIASPAPRPEPSAPASAEPDFMGLTDRQRQILTGIGTDAADIDTIIERTGLPAPVVFQELTFLSLKGQVRRVEGQTYAVRTKRT